MWLARDFDGAVWLYANKPHRMGDEWSGPCLCVPIRDYDNIDLPEVNWEDEEPLEVELTIKKK